MTKITAVPASPNGDGDQITRHAQTLDVAAGELPQALHGYRTIAQPAALTAIRHVVLTLELCAGQIGDTLNDKAIEQDSDPWDHTAIHLYNTASNVYDTQALIASAQVTVARALCEDADDYEPDALT